MEGETLISIYTTILTLSWIRGIEQYGLMGFLERYRQAKKGERAKRKANPIVKRWIWEIREREYDCCGQKIQYFLNLEHNIHL
jgi:hypothetical protein